MCPLVSWSLTPVLTPQVLLSPTWDRVSQGDTVGLHTLCPLLKGHKEVAEQSQGLPQVRYGLPSSPSRQRVPRRQDRWGGLGLWLGLQLQLGFWPC